MNDSQFNGDREIDLIDFLLRLLEQWRGLLLAGIVLALLITGALFFRQSRGEASPTEVDEEIALEDGTETVDMKETSLYTAMNYYEQWKTRKYYYETSYLMNHDAAQEDRLRLHYYIKKDPSADTDLYSVAAAYSLLKYNVSFLEKMADVYNMKKEHRFIEELFTFSAGDTGAAQETAQQGSYLTVTALIVPGLDYKDVEKAIDTFFEEFRETNQSKMGSFSVEKISAEMEKYYNQTVVERQSTRYAEMRSSQSAYAKTYNRLTEAEKSILESMIAQGTVRKWLQDINGGALPSGTYDYFVSLIGTEETAEAEEDIENATGINVLFPVAGFILGLMLYAGLYLVWMILGRRLAGAEDAHAMTGIRSFGAVYHYPYKGIRSFLHDRKVYSLRRGRENHADTSDGRETAERISARAQYLHVDRLSMISLGPCPDHAKEIIQSQIDILRAQQPPVEAAHIAAASGISSIEEKEFLNMGAACVVVLSGITTSEMLDDLLARLLEYDVPVLGTEFLEG